MTARGGNTPILLLALAVVLVGLGAFWLLDREPEPRAEGIGRGSVDVVREPVTRVGPLAAQETARGGPEREAASEIVETPEELPAALVAAQCGFKGRLLLPSGAPVAAALVRIYAFDTDVFTPTGLMPAPGELVEPKIDGGQDLSGEDGRFLVSGVWPRGLYVLHAGAGSELGSAAPLWQLVERTPGPGEVVDLGDLVLRAAGTIVGTVVDDQGEPLAGALVRAADVPAEALALAPLERFHPEGALIVREDTPLVIPMPRWVARRFRDLPIPSTWTDAEGSFRLGGIEPGEQIVVVTAEGFVPHVEPRVQIEAGATRDVGELELDAGDLIEGRVVDGQNRPVPGAQVLLAPATASFPLDFAGPPVTADGEGRFRLAGLPSRRISAAARRDRGEPWTIEEPQFVGRELLLTLPAAHDLTVRLVSLPGLAIQDPELRLLQGSAILQVGEALEMARLGFGTEVELEQRLQELEDGSWLLRDLPAGHYALLATSPGHAVAGASIELRSDREETLSLPAARAFGVRVVDGQGSGIAGATILAAAAGEGAHLSESAIACGRTASDGRLRVTQVSADEVLLTARHPAYGSTQQSARPGGEEVRLVLVEPGALDGALTEDGAPPPPGKWMIVIQTWGGIPAFAAPDLEGRFRVEGLQPGTYQVMVQESMRAVSTPGGLLGFLRDSFDLFDSVQESIEILSGQRSSVTLDAARKAEVRGPSANVAGRARVDGRPAEGMRVVGWTSGSTWHRVKAEVDAAGRFDLGPVAAGNLQLSLEAPSSDRASLFAEPDTLWSDSFKVEANLDLELSIEVWTGSLSGTVLGPDGAPAHACRVEVSPADASLSLSTLTDERGRFSFQTLPEGIYRLEAQGAQGGKAAVAGLSVVAGSATNAVQVRLGSTFRVSGRVDMDAFGEPPRWLWLNLERQESELDPDDSHAAGGARVGSDGAYLLEDLLPGVYTGQFYGALQGTWVLERPIEVQSSDIENLTLHPIQHADVSPVDGEQ